MPHQRGLRAPTQSLQGQGLSAAPLAIVPRWLASRPESGQPIGQLSDVTDAHAITHAAGNNWRECNMCVASNSSFKTGGVGKGAQTACLDGF